MAYQYYVRIKGTKQGTIRGDSKKPNRHDWIEIVGFEWGMEPPVYAKSDTVSGKRQHQPVVINKPAGASTPLLVQAWQTQEPLSEVVIEGTDEGSESVVSRVVLTQAQIIQYVAAQGSKKFTIAFKDIKSARPDR